MSTRARLLLLEDEPALLALLRRMLTHAGYDVRTAKDGEDAIGWALSEPFDLLLLDLQVPYATGLEVLQAVREHVRTRGTPVVLFSAAASERDRCLAAGADAFLTKPFTANELLSCVRELLLHGRPSGKAAVSSDRT